MLFPPFLAALFQVIAQFAGIVPDDFIAGRKRILSAADRRRLTVDPIRPARQIAKGVLIQVIEARYVNHVLRAGYFHGNAVRAHGFGEDIVNLLNTMRVGSQYLTYKRYTDPDFEKKMRRF